MTRRRWGWLAMAAVVTAAFVIGALGSRASQNNSERIDSLSKQIRCLACPGESVFESRVPFAENIRNEIARDVAAGKTDQEIKQQLVASQGDAILLLPPADGATSLLWVLPVVVLLCGGAGLTLAFRRWKQEASMVPSDADRALVDRALAGNWVGGDVSDGADDDDQVGVIA